MPKLKILMNADGMLDGVKLDRIVHVTDDVTIARMNGGMASGAASVSIVAPLPDGRVLVLETSEALLGAAVDAFRARTYVEQQDADLPEFLRKKP